MTSKHPLKPRISPATRFKPHVWGLVQGDRVIEVSVDKSNLAESAGKERIVKGYFVV